MILRVIACVATILCSLGAALAGDRLAVFEFFGRPNGAYCSAAGPAMISLQHELEGRAVLLEYDYDHFPHGRIDRFRATGVHASYLPLVMVGSGYDVSSGPASYEHEYRALIDAELARAPRATVTAYWRRTGVVLRAYLRVDNTGRNTLRKGEEASVWLIAYENAPIGVSSTWVRTTVTRPLERDLAPGEHTTVVLDAPILASVDWQYMNALALVEDRPGGSGRYDMLQAFQALPVDVLATPAELSMHPSRPHAELRLDGPHVLEWSATTDRPWLEISPTSGTLPTTVAVILHNDLRPTTQTTGTVSIDAVGDTMDFELQVPVTAGSPVRHPVGRAGSDSPPGKLRSPSVHARSAPLID